MGQPAVSSVFDTIHQRYSCRSYLRQPILAVTRRRLQEYLAGLSQGPLGSTARFELAAASEEDSQALRGLGTYGFIKHPAGFIIGALPPGKKDLEDYGYLLEQAVLQATELELGTCWLGGSFTQSTFAQRIHAQENELVAAVIAAGYPAPGSRERDLIRRQVRADERLSWKRLFYDSQFGQPLAPEAAGEYAQALEMVRLGPSASNRQPWRVVRQDGAWHFYLERTPGYRSGAVNRLLRLADLQRIDMGIAMCHFSAAAEALGLAGRWQVRDPEPTVPDELIEYTASWETDG
jgi:nitroreductase